MEKKKLLKNKIVDTLPVLYLETVILMVLGQFLGNFVLGIPVGIAYARNPEILNSAFLNTTLMYVIFWGIWAVALFWIGIRKRNRPILQAVGTKPQGNNWKYLLFGLVLGFALNGFCILIAWLHHDIVLTYDAIHPLWFVVVFLTVFIQSSAEELLCRGFLYQKLRRSYKNPVVAIVGNADSKNKVIRKIEKGLETFRYRAPLAHKLSFIRYKQSFAQKYMPLLGIADEMNYNPTVDCLVIGSDEVFNCIQKNSNVGYSPELFGKNNHAKKLITYAASFGNTTLEKLEKYKKANEAGALLKKFDAISVRDANSGTIVEQLTGKEPVYNLDPVLTYDYMNCCDKIPQVQTNEKYLILYAYAGRISNDEADWIAAYAKKKNLKVYAIGGIQKCADRFVDCSPFEVLAYFRNAEEVITDTFHGSIFSVITHRPFTTLIRKSVGNSYGNEEKLSDLLKRLGLANRMTTKIEDTENINEKAIDYAKVDEQLKAHREVAKEYLRKNLEE